MDDATVVMRGSSVTGTRFATGEPFDQAISDFDVAIASPSLLARATELGIRTRAQGTRTAPLWGDDLDDLDLSDLVRSLSRQAGRKVSLMVYASSETILLRGDGILIP